MIISRRRNQQTPPSHRRGAALYLVAISVSTLVAGTGLTLIAVQRSERHLQDNIVRTNEVNWYARAGIEQALLMMEQISDWRSRVTGNKLFNGLPIGSGSVTVEVYDDTDGNLTNNDAQPVRLVATATRGTSISRLSAQLKARPHSALKYAVFGTTSDDMEFRDNCEVRGPVRNHGRIKRSSSPTLWDDAAFETMSGYTIESPLTPASLATAAISCAAPDVNFYIAAGTEIAGDYGASCDVKGYNLTPTSNPLGAPNPNGIYVLRAGGRAVNFENLHLKGTLVITDTGGRNVTFTKGLWIEPGPLRYPTLLIDTPGGAVTIGPSSTFLTEATTWPTYPVNGSNYTPLLPGVDFNENGLTLDALTTLVSGIIWTNAGSVRLDTNKWTFTGTLIGRFVTVADKVCVDNDLTELYDPVPGFVASGMRFADGSHQEVP